jgi:serine/threonine protein kinase
MSEVEDRANLVLAGRYRLIEPIAAGAAPEAWRAEVLSGGHAVVFYYPDAALKGSGAQRFLHEAPYLRGVEHPRLVPLIDVGVDPTGAVYGVTAAFEGRTLAAQVEQVGALSLDDALRVVCDALMALGALHERNLVHQGVTSAEVLLEAEPDGRLRGRLLLAGALGVVVRGAVRGARSDAKMAFGSPHHLAPEQCRAEAVTPETDVWAAGVVLFEALSGAVPFDGETPLEVIAAVLASDVPSLAGRAPAAVLTVLHEALSKRAADRPPDAEAMCLELTAVRGSLAPADAARPARKPTPTRLKTSGISRGQATEFAADDLDALVSTVRAEASPATNFQLELDAHASAEAPPPAGDFDLDFGAPVASPQAHATPGAALPAPPPRATVQPAPPPPPPPRDSITHTSLTHEIIDRTRSPRVQRARSVNPYAAFLGVAAVTGVLCYAGWQLSGASREPSPTYPPAVDEAARRPPAASALNAGSDGATDGGAQDPALDGERPDDAPRPESQTPVEFGEQLLVPMPSLPRDAVTQFVRNVVVAAPTDAARARGFASCADQTVFLHAGGLVAQMRSGPLDARCDALDLALVPDVDGDDAPDVVAVATDSAGLVVVGSRRLRSVRRIALQGAVAVVSGLSRTEHRRSEPVVVVYVSPRGGSAGLVAVGVRSARVYWRTDPSFTPAFAKDYGLAVGPDADGDGEPDVVSGVLREGTRCVMMLSGVNGAPRWPAPRCFDGGSAQTLSLGPDVNEDRRGDVALGNGVEGRARVLSGADGRTLRTIEPPTPGEGISFGLGAVLVPDLAHDGFADVAVPRTQADGASVDVFSANDAHRLGRRALPLRDAPSTALVRALYAEGFAFEGSRSLLLASPLGVTVLGAASRPETRDPSESL